MLHRLEKHQIGWLVGRAHPFMYLFIHVFIQTFIHVFIHLAKTSFKQDLYLTPGTVQVVQSRPTIVNSIHYYTPNKNTPKNQTK